MVHYLSSPYFVHLSLIHHGAKYLIDPLHMTDDPLASLPGHVHDYPNYLWWDRQLAELIRWWM